MHDRGEGPDDDERDDEALELLARRAGAGDRPALDSFLRAVHTPVVRFCRAKLDGSVGVLTADDVAQEVLFALCEALPRYRPDGSAVMAFVIGIAKFKIVDAFRAAGRDRSTASDVMPESADPDPGPEFAAVLSAETGRLRRALARLPENHREIIVLRVALHYSAEEVARILGTSPGAVRVTQHRALRRLRVLLAEPAHPDDY